MSARRSLFVKHLLLQRWQVLATTAFLLTEAAVAVAPPLVMRFIINELLTRGRAARLPAWLSLMPWRVPQPWLLTASIGALAALYASLAMLEIGDEYFLVRAVSGIVEGVRRDLLELLLSRRLSFVDEHHKADVVGRISVDTANLETLLAVGLPTLLRAVPTLAMTLAVLASMDRAFAAAMAAAVAAMFAFNTYFSARVRGYERIGRKELNRFEQNVYETLQAFPLIKSLSIESASFGLSAGAARRITDNMIACQLSESLMSSSLMMTKNVMRLVILSIGGAAVVGGRMQVGDLVAFLAYVESVASPVNDLAKFSVKRARATVGYERIETFVASASGETETGGERALPAGTATPPLRLRGVSVAYPKGPIILRDFCAAFEPGDLVAVAGPSGAGKSTFLKLLNRLIDPLEGELLLDGRPLTEFRLADLRAAVTAIPQEEFFLSGTIRENLKIARAAPASDDELWRALERVQARGFVAALPRGLDTRVGEGGLRPSGGEQRRLSVARAFLRPRRGVFVFDEPTSGLDPEAANAFVASIAALAADGATVLWSTHRVSELETAGRVLFFGAGRNPVLGSHVELLARCPAYAAFLRAGGAAAPRPDDGVGADGQGNKEFI